MRPAPILSALAVLVMAAGHGAGQATNTGTSLKTRAELTEYEETSRYEEVVRFLSELQRRSPLIRVETFGRSQEGRELPLAVLSDPPVAQPRESRESDKPIIFILANIHAGEVEGKEAVLHIARRLLLGELRPLLNRLIVLIAPIYNADGNERISLDNRTEQNGPIGGVGVRENAQGLDLNRDFIKMDAPETQALIRLCNAWDPDVTVDLHTTDGSYHGYHLTYSIPLNPSLNSRLTSYHREKMMPAVTRAMRLRHNFRTYYYGNFSGDVPEAQATDERAWFTFSPQPRVGFNYFGFRNRLSILSEAYSYLDFRRRIEVTEAFVEEILGYCAAHGNEISRLTQSLDGEAIERGRKGQTIGVKYLPEALPKPVEILVGEVTKIKNPRSGHEMLAMVENKVTPVKMRDFGMFKAVRTVPSAKAYLFKAEDGLRVVRDKLLAHGITVEELTEPAGVEVQRFEIGKVQRRKQRFQKHYQVALEGEYRKEEMDFDKGTLLVRTSQPLGLLAAYLLEPESEDGLVTWNFLDRYLEAGKTYPVYKLMQNVNFAAQVVQ